MQVLIPKLKEPDHNPNVVINIMADIGELAQVAREDMRYCVDELCPVIMDMLQLPGQEGGCSLDVWTTSGKHWVSGGCGQWVGLVRVEVHW